jgi:hypothetical protein
MLITPHIAVGSAIGDVLDSTVLVVILSIVSHYLLDMLPHYDSGVRHGNPRDGIVFDFWDWCLVGSDILVGLIIIYIAYMYTGKVNIIWGGMATFMVDFLDKIFQLQYKNGKLGLDSTRKIPIISWFIDLHKKIHYKLDKRYWYWGVLVQAVVLVVGLVIIFR